MVSLSQSASFNAITSVLVNKGGSGTARSPRVCGPALRHPRWTDQPYKEEHTSALQRARFFYSPLRRKTGRIYISFASLLELKKKRVFAVT